LFGIAKDHDDSSSNFIVDKDAVVGKNHKIIIKHYATLYFIIVVDEDESELAILDLL